MDLLRALSSWIESCIKDPAPFPRNAIPAEVCALGNRHGFFRTCGLASTIACPVCDETHDCKVRRTKDGDFEYYCHLRDWRPIDCAAVDLVQFSRPHLIAAIAAAAGSAWSPHQDPGEALVRLGELNTASGKSSWTLIYADGLEAPEKVTMLIQSLKRMKPGGLVITPSSVSPVLPLPKKYVVAPLHVLFRIHSGRLAFDVVAGFGLLGEHADTPAQAGRKSPIEVEKSLWIHHRHDAEWPVGEFGAQADYILARWPSGEDAPRANKRATVAGHISAHQTEWEADAN